MFLYEPMVDSPSGLELYFLLLRQPAPFVTKTFGTQGARMSDARDGHYSASKFRRLQLGTTLRQAAKHSFYRKHWAHYLTQIENEQVEPEHAWNVLARLPITTRRHLAAEIPAELDADDEIVGIGFSSGSSGSVVCRYRTAKEARHAALLSSPQRHSTQSASTDSQSRSALKPLCVDFVATWHGVRGAGAPGSIALPGIMLNDALIERTIQLMRTRFTAPGMQERASVISGGLVGIYTFTRYLVDNSVPASQFGIRGVGVYGGYLGRHRRQLLEEYWNCPVVDSFSIAECNGRGIVCPRCGHLSFDPQLVPQTLRLESDNVVTSGVGRLVLTELYPFGIAQPMIKYLANDVVEWIDADSACSEAHVGGLRRLGRVETSVFGRVNGRRTLLLPSQDLFDICDRDGVSRASPSHIFRGIKNNLDQPWVLADVRSDGSDAHTLVIRYKPETPPVKGISSELAKEVSALPRSAALIRNGNLTIEVVEDTDTAKPPMKFG